ncbi:hypothetical protein [Streptomyces erythrochromogenes]|uniref:hypothetical protein n=1 Tax=Streptomyces erythrochromogenes TaxID=285574 RepID=UPI003867C23B|nr:hypothetical protein OG364_29635 [Streptomyces erythrochromogenes]
MTLDRIRTGLQNAGARTETAITDTLTSPVTAAFTGVVAGWTYLSGSPWHGTALLMTAVGLTATCAAARLGGDRRDDQDGPDASARASVLLLPAPRAATEPLRGPDGKPVAIPQQRTGAAVTATPGGPGGRLFLRPGLAGPTTSITTPEAPMRWTLTACHVDIDTFGWELEGDHYGTHATFNAADADADITAALDWAEGVIEAGPLAWVHSRVEGFDRWQAAAPDAR